VDVAFFRDQIRDAWEWFELTVSDVSTSQANWRPAGTANSIGATYLHVVINADVEIHRLVYGEVPIIERDWNGAIGQGVPYDQDRFDAWVPGVEVEWDRLREYGRAVTAWMIDAAGSVTGDILERTVDMTRAGLGMWDARRLYDMHGVHHVYMHGGEIACLKGLQGAKGYLGGIDA
jgi:hypothetical protein